MFKCKALPPYKDCEWTTWFSWCSKEKFLSAGRPAHQHAGKDQPVYCSKQTHHTEPNTIPFLTQVKPAVKHTALTYRAEQAWTGSISSMADKELSVWQISVCMCWWHQFPLLAVVSGVPQGSVLGSLLFITYMLLASLLAAEALLQFYMPTFRVCFDCLETKFKG